MESDTRLKTTFAGLGKSTMRGLKKCHKCGTYNGTRGLSCKNKACDVVFKVMGEKRKQTIEVAKLDTGTSTRVFSVRVRDKGPDYRGFVQLPVLSSDPTNYLPQMSALCFVDSCQRLFNTNFLKCHERMIPSVTTCSHVILAMRCCIDAFVLSIEYDVLQSLNISQQTKEEIWQMANETPGPLVQRVSKNVMAVKCKVTSTEPLGFLHVMFFTSKKLKENHSICTCSNADKSKYINTCIHYYACIAAFASDSKCSQEFYSFIAKEKIPESYTITVSSQDGEEEPLYAVLTHAIDQNDVEVEVLQKDLLLQDITDDLEGLTTVADASAVLNDDIDSEQFVSIIKPVFTNNKIKTTVSKEPKTGAVKKPISKNRKKLNKDLRRQLDISDEPLEENKIQMFFVEWLASVTERINQAMHYQFDGKPEPLVFHAPHTFFECLMERVMMFSVGGRRKRLPNLVTTFTRKSAPPIGVFISYTWNISNILHAKAIFDTPMIKLNVSRSFLRRSDGTYEDFDVGEVEQTIPKKGQPPLRPMEYKTYLKIGHTSPNQDSPSLMSIDWTPNVLPVSKIGELKISFEYGHTQNPVP